MGVVSGGSKDPAVLQRLGEVTAGLEGVGGKVEAAEAELDDA